MPNFTPALHWSDPALDELAEICHAQGYRNHTRDLIAATAETIRHATKDGGRTVFVEDIAAAVATLSRDGRIHVAPPPPPKPDRDVERRTLLLEVLRACRLEVEAAQAARGNLLLLMRAKASGRPGEANDLLEAVGIAYAVNLATIAANRDLIDHIHAALQ